MQSKSTAFKNAINSNSALYTQPKVIADFNMNICSTVSVVGNKATSPDTGGDSDYYDINAVGTGNRPAPGVALAKVGDAVIPQRRQPSYTVLGENQIYKYWVSSALSATSTSVNNGVTSYAIGNIAIYVLYLTQNKTNLIQIGFPPAVGIPIAFDVQITTDGTTWTTISQNTGLNSKNQVQLYLQNNGTWTTTYNINNFTLVKGVAIVPKGMNNPSVPFEVTDVSAHYVVDISSDIIDMSVNKTLTDQDLTRPFGAISSNSFNVTLDNSSGKYIDSNAASPFWGLLTKNVQLTVQIGVDTSGTNGATMEWCQQGIFYVDDWGDEGQATVTTTATDFTKFLQQQSLLPKLFVNKTVGFIVRSILNLMGFDNFSYWPPDIYDTTIPYFWFNTTDMAWDVLTALCEATQSIVFLDEFEVMQVVTRNTMSNPQTSSDSLMRYPPAANDYNYSYVLSSVPFAGIQPNIIDVSHQYSTQVNEVIINYSTLSINKDIFGRPLTTTVWTPADNESVTNTKKGLTTTTTFTSDQISIMSGYLAEAMDATQTYVKVDHKTTPLFAFNGFLNIDGEVMEYDKKEYAYYPTGSSTLTKVWVKSQEDVNNINANLSNFNKVEQNHFTTKLHILNRGVWGTTATTHKIHATDNWGGNFTQHKSTIKLKGKDHAISTINRVPFVGGGITTGWKTVGTQIMFKDTKGKHQSGGLYIDLNNTLNGGIFIDLRSTKFADKSHTVELSAFTLGTSGLNINKTLYFNKYRRFVVAEEAWYAIDVAITDLGGGNYQYDVYFEGALAFTFQSSVAPPSANFGVWVKGDTHALFEYFYGVSGSVAADAYEPALYGILDRIDGGYISNSVSANVLYKRKAKSARWREWHVPFFDDFGSYVHEIRPFTAQFDNVPALGAQLYLTNDKYLEVVKFDADAFSANFYVANKMRDQLHKSGVAVMQGSDTTDLGADHPVEQTALIYAYVPTSSSQKTLTEKNQPSINNYGVSQLTFNSQWIQTDSDAKDLADWCTTHWSQPVETLSANVWINPACQLLDSTYVNFPVKSIANYYYITGISIGWSGGGLTGNVTLQASLI